MSSLLITGGLGFIGSHLVRRMARRGPVVVVDRASYAANPVTRSELEQLPNVRLEIGDVGDRSLLHRVFSDFQVRGVIHLAAESHVDRSIAAPLEFVQTNVVGTCALLQTAVEQWKGRDECCFHHVSTDEVYGSLGAEGQFSETTAYAPRSPYAASKAASDHLVRAFGETYGLPIKVSNCSNNYGPYQHPEKLIPLCITRLLSGGRLPVYGKGDNVRDWLYVEDHAAALEQIFHRGSVGATYNVGGSCERSNLELVQLLCSIADQQLGREPGSSAKLIDFVTDRPGHDFRYAVDHSKLTRELGWKPETALQDGLQRTFAWYRERADWLACFS